MSKARLTQQHFKMFADHLASMWFSTTQLEWENNVNCVIKLCKFGNSRFDENIFRTYIGSKIDGVFKRNKK